MKNADVECAIIGAGPAGLTAAIYLLRFLRKVRLIHHGDSRASWIPVCHNLIGYDEGISGKDLLNRLWRQANKLNLQSIEARAHVHHQDGVFVIDNERETVTAKKLILATGAIDRQPKWDNLKELREAGLLRYCPICDGFEHQNAKLAVVVDGEHGLREATFLSHYSRSILVCSDVFPISEKRKAELAGRGIQVAQHTLASVELLRSQHVKKLNLHFQDRQEIQVDAVYIGLGRDVQTAGLDSIQPLQRGENGLLRVGDHQTLEIPGAYAAGDCVEGLSQIAVAAGQGAMAAVAVHNALAAER